MYALLLCSFVVKLGHLHVVNGTNGGLKWMYKLTKEVLPKIHHVVYAKCQVQVLKFLG